MMLTARRDHAPPDPSLLSIQSNSPATQASGSSIRRAASTSSPRSLSVATSLSSDSRHGSFQYQGAYVQGAPISTISVPSTGGMAANPILAAWRPQDGGQSSQALQPLPHHAQEPHHVQHANPYASAPPQKVDWQSGSPSYQYGMNSEASQHPGPSPYEHPLPPAPPPPPPAQQPSQQPQQYVPQMSTPQYSNAPAPHQQAYQAQQIASHPEYQSMAVSSPAPYQVQQQPSYQPPVGYQLQPMQGPPPQGPYAPQQGQMQPPALPAAPYQPLPEHQYPPPQIHPPMQYHEQPRNQGYPMPHYPVG